MYPPITLTRHGMRLVLEEGTGQIGSKFVELHVWRWDPDTGWAWIDAQMTDSKPCMLASHRNRLRRYLSRVHGLFKNVKTREGLKTTLGHVSHSFPNKLPDLSFRARRVTDALPRRSLAGQQTEKPHTRRSRPPRGPRPV